MDMRLSKLRELVMDREAWRAVASTYGIFQARILEWVTTGLLHCRQTLYCLSQQGSLPEMGSL